MRSLTLILLAIAAPAGAAELRDLCPDRPGNATPPCIVNAGHVQVETAAFDWSRDRRDGVARDDFGFAATEVRFGLAERTEVSLAWSPFNSHILTDRRTGYREHTTGTGDLTFALRRSLANPDGKGLSLAVQPFVTAPTGSNGFGNDGWSGGVLLPFAAELPGGFGLGATPEIDWSVDAADGGHHATWTGVVSLSHAVGGVQAGVELWVSRDDDPAGATTQATADMTLAWTPPKAPNLQFDAGLNAGLNSATPQLELYAGISRRF